VKKYGTARQATDDNIIRCMRFACWITKATDTHSQYVILIAFPRQQWLRERASMPRLYVHCLSPLLFPVYRLPSTFNHCHRTLHALCRHTPIFAVQATVPILPAHIRRSSSTHSLSVLSEVPLAIHNKKRKTDNKNDHGLLRTQKNWSVRLSLCTYVILNYQC
jgi:hypothetical protein